MNEKHKYLLMCSIFILFYIYCVQFNENDIWREFKHILLIGFKRNYPNKIN